jgi:hypothetical protein
MDHNYTLKYKTFDQLLEDVTVDLNTYALENMIEPQTLIKVAKRVTYDLGLRINQTKQIIIDVDHSKAKLPDDFFSMNYAGMCAEFTVHTGYDIGGTNIQEIPYTETPADTPACVTPDEIIKPRVITNCKNEQYEIVQILSSGQSRVYNKLIPITFTSSQHIENNCMNLNVQSVNQASIKAGYIFTNFESGKIYLNYQGALEDEDGNLLVPDHEYINEYYEYALKQRIFENLYLNGEDVSQKLQLIESRMRGARNNALSFVNTPNFKELEDLWKANRRVQYSRYYDMFKSH